MGFRAVRKECGWGVWTVDCLEASVVVLERRGDMRRDGLDGCLSAE